MPTASVVAVHAQKYPYEANVRMLTGFNSLAGGQDRLGWLERRRSRTCASPTSSERSGHGCPSSAVQFMSTLML